MFLELVNSLTRIRCIQINQFIRMEVRYYSKCGIMQEYLRTKKNILLLFKRLIKLPTILYKDFTLSQYS